MTGFIFGGNTGLSYDQLQKQRKQLDAQRGQRFAPKNVGEGLSALGHALGTRITNKRLGEAETARQGRADNAFSTFQTLLGGGGRQPVNPMQPPSASGDQNSAFGGDLKSGIAATAQSLGVDPVDLATAISYETAGTFDPKKAGPTTQWGQHRGLIQFGEPQAKKYGVNWDDPIGSQLGENGAVANYLRDTGVKPGMGLLDIYSAINAGGVGRYNRSDANNGGAPGNVRDKVEQQMAGHRAKAQAMFGGDQVAQPQPQSGGIDPKLHELMSDPSLSPRRQSAMQMLLEQKLKANGPTDPMGRLQMERLQLQNKQLRNPAAPERKIIKGADGLQYYQDDGSRVLPDVEPQPGYQMVSPDKVQELGLPTGSYQQGPKGRISQVGGKGTNVTVNNGEPADGNLRKSLDKSTGQLWSKFQKTGAESAAMSQDFAVLDELIKVAPQGPLSGRFHEMFPGVSSAGDAFQSIVKRLAPTLRVEGSGSTSDIEYEGMLRGMPALRNKPEANALIAQIMKSKSSINIERAAIISDYSQGDLSAKYARKKMSELNKRSIMTPEMHKLLVGVGQSNTNDGATKSGLIWKVE